MHADITPAFGCGSGHGRWRNCLATPMQLSCLLLSVAKEEQDRHPKATSDRVSNAEGKNETRRAELSRREPRGVTSRRQRMAAHYCPIYGIALASEAMHLQPGDSIMNTRQICVLIASCAALGSAAALAQSGTSGTAGGSAGSTGSSSGGSTAGGSAGTGSSGTSSGATGTMGSGGHGTASGNTGGKRGEVETGRRDNSTSQSPAGGRKPPAGTAGSGKSGSGMSGSGGGTGSSGTGGMGSSGSTGSGSAGSGSMGGSPGGMGSSGGMGSGGAGGAGGTGGTSGSGAR